MKKTITRAGVTRWNAEALALGAMSAAVPGGHAARAVLAEPVRDAVWFAGEAVHETLWGTVGGAWESGERAADAVLRRLSGQRQPEVDERRRARKRKSRRGRFDEQ
jgi:monoamine oxidase